MLPKIQIFLLGLITSIIVFSQDSAKRNPLDTVIIKAFEQNKALRSIPAPVNYISSYMLDRYNPISIVSVINSTPGVHMEERSPGSYRFNMRGSSLRSPFGVRNIKVYYNELPYTDPSGNTYLNQLGFYNFNSVELIKGPGSSLYGAGTGGVMLIKSLEDNPLPGEKIEYTTGSYNLQNIYASLTSVSDNMVNRVFYQHQESNGYRIQSAMKRNMLSWNGNLHFKGDRRLDMSYLYGDLYYQTPGGLTRSEYIINGQASRPAAGGFPSAQTANAAITQKTFLAGAAYSQPVLNNLINKTVVYGAFTELRNPGIRNYGKNSEPHTGTRTIFTWHKNYLGSELNLVVGGEIQTGFFTENVFKNVNGNPDTLQSNDEINNRQSFIFAQASLDLKQWTVTGGASWNWLYIKFQRFQPNPLSLQNINFNNEAAPRLSILRKFQGFTIYGSVSRGFSPPTTAELFPTGSAINSGLNAEYGVNYEIGIRGTFLKKMYADINGFLFSLHNAIVQRRDAGGGDYYINSGKTRQHGVETFFNYPMFLYVSFIDHSSIWLSYTWHNFHYTEFKQLANDFSGNKMPGEPLNTVSSGFDFFLKNGFYTALTYYYSDKIPLNDANSDFANSYELLGVKIGFLKRFKNLGIKIYTGGDNILNQKYSLGNDINAAAGRYYNQAGRRNYYAGISLQLLHRNKTIVQLP